MGSGRVLHAHIHKQGVLQCAIVTLISTQSVSALDSLCHAKISRILRHLQPTQLKSSLALLVN